jgi:tRNA-splicing ligase RtcB (3'-phosphate/5'-hydroxy nucleic acid ligase)
VKARQMLKLGIPGGDALRLAERAAAALAAGGADTREIRRRFLAVVAAPGDHLESPELGALAAALVALEVRASKDGVRSEAVRYRRWGDDVEPTALTQMDNACRLPISVAGALMPDAHQGYGLPIGGVLATRNAVIPYAVGVDIACRMKLSVLDLPPEELDRRSDRLRRAIVAETSFGVGAIFRDRRRHEVMDRDWRVSPITERLKDKAWSQLGTSGSGNHFVELGVLTLAAPELGLEAGRYLALLSHSGSRGTGAAVADHYSRLARSLHRDLPKELAHLAWLDLDSDNGREYWQAMQLMGRYAAANHELIHRQVVRHLGAAVLAGVENHHNFAWIERHRGQEVVVHRKGATPAGEGDLGVIPGSMASPAYVVRGRGNPDSLRSAAHGAGRRMSRTEARRRFSRRELDALLAERGVHLISAGLDEVPMAYKDIDAVMAAQRDLVAVIARFDPRLVKMAPPGERPED